MSGKRKLSPRFSEEEKKFLNMLVEQFQAEVENKETDAVSSQSKKKAWMNICDLFNKEPDHLERTVSQLQKCWDNMKTKRKHELQAAKRARMATGGGPPPPSDGDDSIDALLDFTTDIEVKDSIDSDAIKLSECGTDTYVLEGDILKPLENISVPEQIQTPKQIYKHKEVPQSQPKDSTCTLKRKVLSGRQFAIDSELEVRLEKQGLLVEQDKAIFEIRKREAETKCRIAEECLKEAEIKTETARIIQQYEIKIYQAKLESEIKKCKPHS